MDAATRQLVLLQAENRCEYCLLRQEQSGLFHHVEHIIAKQHGGSDEPGNLALACHRCNTHKGPNLAGIDPGSGELIALLPPRRDVWLDHFDFEGARIVGRTPSGRAKVDVRAMNDERRLERRVVLLSQDEFL